MRVFFSSIFSCDLFYGSVPGATLCSVAAVFFLTLTCFEFVGYLTPYRTIQYPDQAPPPYRDCVGGERPEYRAT